MKNVLRTLFLVLCLGASCGYAAGFSILEQSAKGMGKALGGMTADTQDPAALYFNPSVAAFHTKPQLAFSNHFLRVSAFFQNHGSSSSLGSDEGNNMGGWSMVPNFYWVHPFADGFSFGLGASATSGTKTSHPNNWIGRYTGLLTDIAVIDINPMLSYRITDDLSIGAGLVVEYAEVTMDTGNDFRALGLADGKTKMRGDSYAAGFTLGLTYKVTPSTTLGLGYRSRMRHEVDLEIRAHNAKKLGQMVKGMGGNWYGEHGDGKAVLHLPATLNFGIEQKMTEKWRLGLDISYYFQSYMKDLRVKFEDGYLTKTPGSEQRTEMNWRNSFRVALGSEYDLTEKLTWRFGLAWDQTPATAKYRNTAMPDADRFWVSTGASYKLNDNWTLDAAYTRLTFEHVGLNQLATERGERVRGKVGGHCDTFSLGARYSF